MRSGFFPKILGVLLILTGSAYVVSFVTAVVFPAYASTVTKVALPLYFGEFIVILWMAFVGAKPRSADVGRSQFVSAT